MFWVPDEPWGWIPYHLGVWHWNAKFGWLWVPGSVFAPAWVDWYYASTYFAWTPYSLTNWTNSATWQFVDINLDQIFKGRKIIGQVSKDQLAQPGKPTSQMPKEFKGIIKNLEAGIARRDPALLVSLRMQREAGTAVSWDRLGVSRIQDLALSLGALSAGGKSERNFSPLTPREVALRTSNQFRTKIASPGPAPRSAPPSPGSMVPPQAVSPAALRIHDWNPDARLAARYGFSVKYDSRLNVVYGPELRMRFGDRMRGGGMSGGGFGSLAISGGDAGVNPAGTAAIQGLTPPAGGQAGRGSGSGSGGGGAEKK